LNEPDGMQNYLKNALMPKQLLADWPIFFYFAAE
jgi:hypothetical protein